MALRDLLARSEAARRMMLPQGDSGLPPEATLPDEAAPAPPVADLESALAGVEAAIEELEPEKAEKIREHLNAIRDLAVGGEEEANVSLSQAEALPEIKPEKTGGVA